MHNGHRYGPQDATSALQFLDAGGSREAWVRTLMSAKAAGVPEDEAIAWSANAPNFGGERDVRSVWRSIRPDGGIGPGTLFRMAQEAGWKPRQGTERTWAGESPGQGTRTAPPKESAEAVWSRCVPATDAHPYIVAKAGRPDGLRVLPQGDPLRIAGQSVAGWLVVPAMVGGVPSSLQFIPPPGEAKKLNLQGARIEGWFTVGEVHPGGVVHVCEGLGQAWACWKATGHAAVVAFGWGRVAKVAGELRQRDPSAVLVLVPDVGKEADAERIARDVSARVAAMPEGSPANFDANDYGQREGFDALEVLLSQARAPALRFRLLGSEDLGALPPLAWRVRGVLPAHGIASFYGASASGKSFLAFDMAAAVAEGAPWFGHRTKAAPVVYVALEGEAGFRLRVAAWERDRGRPLPAGLRLVLQPFKLLTAEDVADMAAAVGTAGSGAVTILDTLNRAAPGADENSPEDMGRIIEAASTLQRLTGGLVIAVHHSGKDPSKGLRGHSSLFAALDAAVEVTRDGSRRAWRIAKVKDGEDGVERPFRLAVVELGQDEDGEPLTSCVVREDMGAAEVQAVRLPQGGNQRIVLDALRPMFKASRSFGKGGAPATRPCVELEAAVTAAGGRLTVSSDRRAERARAAVTGLVSRGVLGCGEGWLWLV
jgi:hypothetical protein